MFVDLYEAIEIVLQLARMGALDEKEASQDPEVLEPMRQRQEAAIDTVQDFVKNNVFDKED
jgi:hypothetical protein